MSLKDFTNQTFDGYRLDTLIDSTDIEWRFAAEAERSGVAVHVRVPRVDDDQVVASLKARYDGEFAAARLLQSTGIVLSVRDVIQVDGRPALVTNRPHGQSLADIFAGSSRGRPLAEVLPWFRKLVIAFEAAHRDGAAHGSLGPGDVFQDDGGRLMARGLAMLEDDHALAQARRADVHSLAGLLYQATTGQLPEAGFPHAGEPTPANQLVEDYPESLSRFLSLRLAGDPNDAVTDAGVFRRSLDAMAEYAEVRRQVDFSPYAERRPDIIVERDAQPWRRYGLPVLTMLAAAAVGALATWFVMDGRRGPPAPVETASARAAPAGPTSTDSPPVPTTGTESRPALSGRSAVWQCVHREFAAGGDGSLSPRELMGCMRAAPQLTTDELRLEAMRIVASIEREPRASDEVESRYDGFRKLFALGPDEVEQYVTYRLSRRLSVNALESWALNHGGPSARAVLRTLAGRTGTVGIWASRTLQGPTRAADAVEDRDP